MSMQALKNKAFRVSVRWDALVRKPLALERGGFTKDENLRAKMLVKY
ncbi:hypothetical protein HPSA20_0501 [Helicobacter pylori SouthAfrica20]|uniref:Uncharacterized protein n=1 Tax=Helicobacter pylori SouthAfrica20 TaxID=1352356 RepID=T1U913_HELPX|nr:hypothetical protein HPSA20_0501 [Helicobacter pylori SouthAfrica20]